MSEKLVKKKNKSAEKSLNIKMSKSASIPQKEIWILLERHYSSSLFTTNNKIALNCSVFIKMFSKLYFFEQKRFVKIKYSVRELLLIKINKRLLPVFFCPAVSIESLKYLK